MKMGAAVADSTKPIAQVSDQIRPRICSRTHRSYPLQKCSIVRAGTALAFGSTRHKAADTLPSIISKCVAIHHRPAKVGVESDLLQPGNP